MSGEVSTAMVLAAGLGKRMRPLTDNIPKPLVALNGRPLIDHVLARLSAAGIKRAVVNTHYKADVLERHLAHCSAPDIIVSNEGDALLDTGGGIVRALPLLGRAPFLIHNSDSVWIENGNSNIARLISAWDPANMDCLMLLAKRETSLGYSGDGDFVMAADGVLDRRPKGTTAPFVFAGVSIMSPHLFEGLAQTRFSLNLVWDKAIARARQYGIVLDGTWMHVGTPAALEDAQALISAHQSGAL